MGTVLTVQAKMTGDASSLVNASKQSQRAIQDLQNSAKGNVIGDMASRAGSGLASIAATAAKAALAVTAIGVAATGALAFKALSGGMQRLEEIQDSTVSLTRMMGSAADAANLTAAALKVVTGTPFALPDFDQAARQLYAYGVQASKIPGMLTAIADSAAASGQGQAAVQGLVGAFADMAVEGKVNLQTLQEFGTSGVNGIGILANHFGLTTEAMENMISYGFVPSDEAMQVLTDGIEKGSHGIAGNFNSIAGAAQDLGQTMSGSFGNLKTAMDRMGASILVPFQKDIPDAINDGLIPLLDTLGGAIGKITTQIESTGAIKDFTQWIENLTTKVGPTITTLEGFWKTLSPLGIVFTALKQVMPTVQGAFGDVAQTVAMRLVPAVANLFVALTPLLPIIAQLVDAFAKGLSSALPAVTGLLNVILPIVTNLVNAFAQLPGPVLAAVVALVGLNKVAPVGGILEGVANGLANIVGKAAGLTGGGGAVADAVGAVGTTATEAAGTAGGSSGVWGLVSAVAELAGPEALGALGAVIGTGVFDFSAVQSTMGAAAVSSDQLTGTLNGTTGAMTKQTDAAIKLNLLHNNGAAYAKEFGVSLDTLTKAAEGDTGAQNLVSGAVKKYSDAMNAASKGQINLSAGQQKVITDGNYLIMSYGNQNSQIQKLLAQQKDWIISTGAMKTTHDALNAAMTTFNSTLKTNGRNTDVNSAAYKANKAALDQTGASALAYIQTLDGRYGPASLKATEGTHDTVDALVSAARQMGMSKSAADTYAASILGIPVSRVTQIEAETAAAAHAIQTVAAAVNSLPGIKTINIQVQTSGLGAARTLGMDENGGVRGKAFANGGMQAYASGGLSSGIYQGKGAGIVKFAERQTNWEAYISGRFGQEDRNREVLMNAAARLGMLDTKGGDKGPGLSITNHIYGQDPQVTSALIAQDAAVKLGTV